MLLVIELGEPSLLYESLVAVGTILALGVGFIAVLMLATETGPVLAVTQLRLLEVLGWGGLFAGSVLLLRVLLEVLRHPHRERGTR